LQQTPTPTIKTTITSILSMSLNDAFSYLSTSPLCFVALDSKGHATHISGAFEKLMGPLYKFQEFQFCDAATEKNDGKEKMRDLIAGIQSTADAASYTIEEKENETFSDPNKHRVRNIEMLTLAAETSGIPMKRHFNWTVGKGGDGTVLLFGDICHPDERTEEEIARDVEYVDFFQNAPIALHWLSGEGIVLWANQTELDFLGYTAEEYIGQPIMKFCPDEQELVLEIFKRLGSGNSIKDVPVRFRTKDNRIVHLLIDSNVRYDTEGKFAHTRCFIRDDTARKVKEARARLLLEETKRSLRQLDIFMSRTLHHMRTPLHVMQTTCDIIISKLTSYDPSSPDSSQNVEAVEEALTLVKDANVQVVNTVNLIDDVFDLLKFDQGTTMDPKKNSIPTRLLCYEVLSEANSCSPSVTMELEICDGVPSQINCDIKILKRILLLILNNACDASSQGKIEFIISSDDENNYIFSVVYKEPGQRNKDDSQIAEEGKKPHVFQRHHEELPTDIVDFEEADKLRRKIEKGLSCCRTNSIGVSLPLSYHLVQTLGAELKYESTCGLKFSDLSTTKLWFQLPPYQMPFLSTERVSKNAPLIKKAIIQSQNLLENSETIMQFKKEPTRNKTEVPNVKVASDIPSATEIPNNKNASEIPADKIIKTPTDKVTTKTPTDKIPTKTPTDKIPTKTPTHKTVTKTPCVKDEPKVPSKKIASEGLKASAKPHVLVVEDTDICAKLICMILRKLNYSTERAENGQVALDLLREQPEMYSLVLMDLRMPVMDGFEATTAIKKYLKLDIPVVALTGETSNELRIQCEEIGFDGFYQKPLKRKQLEEVVKKYTSAQSTGEQ